jgi:HEAT repeat protein
LTESDPLADLFERAQGDEPIPEEAFHALNALEGEALGRFRVAWGQLDADHRFDLLDQLSNVIEDDLSLNVASVCQVAFTDDDPAVRERAYVVAGEDGSLELFDPLLAASKSDADREARMAAIEALGTFTLLAQADDWPVERWEPAQRVLLDQIERSRLDPAMWAAALLSLAYLTTPEAEREIRRAYAEPGLQEAAIEAMGRNCQPLWSPQIRVELRSDDAAFRLQAVLAAAEMEDEELVPDLVARTDDPDPEVRLSAIEALGIIGGEEAENILTQLERSRDPDVRRTAAQALREARSQQDLFGPGFQELEEDGEEDDEEANDAR